MYIIVAGAGIVGSRVTRALVANKHDVVVIDKDRDVCEMIYSEIGAMTINDNATRIKVLKDAGVKKADALLCLMRNDADNISCALLAKSLGLEEIVARLRQPQYKQAYETAGIKRIVNISQLLVDRLIIEVEKPSVRRIFSIESGQADVYAIRIKANSQSIGMTIKDIAQHKKFPDECVFMGIYDKSSEDFHIPRGNHILKEDNMVFITSKSQFINQAAEFLTRQKRSFFPKKILDR